MSKDFGVFNDGDGSTAFELLNRLDVFGIVLILDLADDLLEHILDGREPGYATVLIDHDGHVLMAFAKFL